PANLPVTREGHVHLDHPPAHQLAGPAVVGQGAELLGGQQFLGYRGHRCLLTTAPPRRSARTPRPSPPSARPPCSAPEPRRSAPPSGPPPSPPRASPPPGAAAPPRRPASPSARAGPPSALSRAPRR